MFAKTKNEMIEACLVVRSQWNRLHRLTNEENATDCDLYRNYLESMSTELLELEYVEITGNELAL